MRSLNSELGLSHGTINQRFGTKEQLYIEAVDHGFTQLLRDLTDIVDQDEIPDDPLEELRIRFRAFLLASARRPHLNRVINNEGVTPSKILDRIFDRYIFPAMRPTRRLLDRLESEGLIVHQPDRTILFMLANGAGSLCSLAALSKKFDRIDGPADPEKYADSMSTLLVNGMRKPPKPVKPQPAKRSSSSRKT